jgi:hypothetical protein
MANREAEMSPVVSEWLKSLGLTVYAEISGIDHVGINFETGQIVCVEMKTSCTKELFQQARQRQLITEHVYLAVPRMPQKKSLEQAKQWGLGVWVNGKVVLEPHPQRIVVDHYRKRIGELCRRLVPGGIGGVPTTKGDGPAIRVADLVKEYREKHLAAKWDEIWATVPNHYKHPASMASAMRRHVEQ